MDFSEEMIDEVFKIFQVESEEIIEKMNNNLLVLEQKPNDKDSILLLFRDAHSLKGASRMVGLNNVQTIAHKIEDVLGLAKENKISFNTQVVNVLYKTVDFLSELIQKAIERGQDVYSDDIAFHLENLESVLNNPQNVEIKDEPSDFNKEIFLQNNDDVTFLIPEALFSLMKIEIEKDYSLISHLLKVTTKLYDIFKATGPYDIKKPLEDIKVKLEFILKASNSLTNEEVEDIHTAFGNIINTLSSLFELHGIELVDYYGIAFSKTGITAFSENSREKTVEESQEIAIDESKIASEQTIINVEYNQLDNAIEDIRQKFQLFVSQGGSLREIKDDIIKYKLSCSDSDVVIVLEKISEILNFSMQNEMKLEEETISVIIQSIQYCEEKVNNESLSTDKDLIVQRLEIIQQVLKFSEQKSDDNKLATSKKFKVKDKNITDFSDVFNTGDLKTLRVDSVKLDTLVNQVNELTINKIKTKKHLHELNLINKELEEWQKNSVKSINYLKHYDKKFFQTFEAAQSSVQTPEALFIKQLFALYSDMNKKAQETILNISNLQKNIQEDEAKMNLLVGDLDNMVKNIRVLPLATVFHLFGRMVRDIAQEKGKQINLEIIGSDTCTDKKIIEEIKTPLIHIIRNAIDHGIETPDERIAAGKNPTGKITLAAKQVNNKVIIEIRDDGRGVNIEKIKDKAVKKGFLTQEEIDSMTSEQVTNIIFAPGFSTGEEITNISGRGIGLDVVQSKISLLNGKVRVLSEVNKGCCVQIELPTTMSILNVFLVQSSEDVFAIPMESVKTVLRKKPEDIIFSSKGKAIIFNDETIHLFRLSDILHIQEDSIVRDKETLLIVENEGKRIALSVDKLIGDQEVLYNKLPAPVYKLKNVAGITTLVSGQICLILNVSDILKSESKHKETSNLALKCPKKQNNEYKILLVDDSVTTRTLEKNILTQAGYNIEMAENPIEALHKMAKECFDLIISDVEMPEMDGFEFLEKIKTDEMFCDIPVIMVSSLMTDEKKNRAAQLGAKKYIVKGEFEQDYFQQAIRDILEN